MKIFRALQRFVAACRRRLTKAVLRPTTETVAGASLGAGLGRIMLWGWLGVAVLTAGAWGALAWVVVMVAMELWINAHLFRSLATLVAFESVTAPAVPNGKVMAGAAAIG